MQQSQLCFWNLLEFFSPNIFYLWLVECRTHGYEGLTYIRPMRGRDCVYLFTTVSQYLE